MAVSMILKSVASGLLSVLIWAEAGLADNVTEIAPPGAYHTSWIGNSFGGSGAKPTEGSGFQYNGFGYWVQDSVTTMAVAPDGTVFIGSLWDESGRGVGLYKNGMPNRVLVKAEASPIKVFDFNAANKAICVDGAAFFVGNIGKGLLRFQWTPGDINSAQYLDEVSLPEVPVSLSCSGGKILVAYPDQVERRDETSMQVQASYPVSGLSAILLAPDGSFWGIAGGQVHHFRADGSDTGTILPGIGNPVSLAWGPNSTLIVSDNGPAQQVLFFDVAGVPKLASSFGVKGGISSGVPGAVAPQKLFALRGAGVDAAGSLYVGMGFSPGPAGNTFIRAFSPSGALLWENFATAFIDTFGFEPGSDGTIVYGRTTRWKLDLSRQKPGTEATLEAITLDPVQYPDDPRTHVGYAMMPRSIDGTQLLYGASQTERGLSIFAGAPGTDILHFLGATPKHGWGWFVTDDGDIWNADAPGRKIALYRLNSVTAGVPIYDWQHPQTWPWPADFSSVSRVIYQKSTDTLYVFGDGRGQQDNGAWGVLGWTGRRYDGWLAGHPAMRWTNTALPGSGLLGVGKLVPAKDVSLAGDYLFLGMVRDSKQHYLSKVDILNAATGQYVGTLKAGPEVGNLGGWEDMVGSVQATETSSGEYLVLVEDDWRAKNILLRWKP